MPVNVLEESMVSFVITFQDFKAAQRLCSRRSLSDGLLYFLVCWSSVVSFVVCVGLFALTLGLIGKRSHLSPFLTVAMVTILAVGFFRAMNSSSKLRQHYNKSYGRQEGKGFELWIENDELVYRTPGAGEARIRRESIIDFMTDDTVTLLFVAKRKFLILPHHASPGNQRENIVTWLGQSHA